MNTQTKEQQDDFHRNVDATSKNIERLQEVNRVLLEACRIAWAGVPDKARENLDSLADSLVGMNRVIFVAALPEGLIKVREAIAKAEGR